PRAARYPWPSVCPHRRRHWCQPRSSRRVRQCRNFCASYGRDRQAERWRGTDPKAITETSVIITGARLATIRVILCEQTVILDSLHHLFNALAHVGVAVQ